MSRRRSRGWLDVDSRAWDAISAHVVVSRETQIRLESYADLLIRWNRVHNLIGSSTIRDIWSRHIVDSAQLLPLLPKTSIRLADIGTGAGFPGLVLALLGVRPVYLIEKDQKKAAFLREAARITASEAVVLACDVRCLGNLDVDIVTARAVAPLTLLLDFASEFRTVEQGCLFLKGQNVDAELTQAAKAWHMEVEVFESMTDGAGRIVQVRNFHRR